MSFLAIPPALAVIAVLGVIYGALFHLWRGKSWRDLGYFILMALIGLIVGQLIGVFLELNVLKLGQVHIVEGTIFAWLFMLAFAWLKG
jgi:FtsH-binding integral membrane protein